METVQSVAAAGLIMAEIKNRLYDQDGNREMSDAGYGASFIANESDAIDIQKKWERLLSFATGALDVSREKTGNDVD